MSDFETTCRSTVCKRKMLMVTVDGKAVQLDARRTHAYTKAEDGTWRDGGLVYVSHFITCPDAAKFSRGGGKG